MGLDMYLEGRRFFPSYNRQRPTRTGFPLSEEKLDLGYWRKHSNLHGFIVQTFANGVDECQLIDLLADDIRTIIAAVEAGTLPQTSGFFFGESTGSERENDIAIFEDALKWLEEKDPQGCWRSITYQASW